MKGWHVVFAAGCAALLGACAAPDYRPASSGALAQVRFLGSDMPQICTSGKVYTLRPDSGGNIAVPAGRPVHLMTRLTYKTSFCFPVVKFVPQAGQAYDIVVEARDERCIATVMSYDRAASNGVRLVPSTSPGYGECG